MTPERLAEIEREHGWQFYVADLLTALREAQAEVERPKKFVADYDVMEPIELRDMRRERDALQRRVDRLTDALGSHSPGGSECREPQSPCVMCNALRGEGAK